MKSGEVLDYTYSQPKDEDDFVLKVSSHPDYFEVGRYSVEGLRDVRRERLVLPKKQAESAEGGGEAEAVEQGTVQGGNASAPAASVTPPPSRSP